jgi:DnaJ-class molecular chaperone
MMMARFFKKKKKPCKVCLGVGIRKQLVQNHGSNDAEEIIQCNECEGRGSV